MLCRKYFRRRHHCCLKSVFNRRVNNCGGNSRFARAHIALNKPVHRAFAFHIGNAVGNRSRLCAGRFERQCGQEFVCKIGFDFIVVCCFFFVFEFHQPDLQSQKFLKNQPFSCNFYVFTAVGEMNLPYCAVKRTKVVFFHHTVGQCFLNLADFFKRRLDGFCYRARIQLVRCGINRVYAGCALRRFNLRRIHICRSKAFFNLAV